MNVKEIIGNIIGYISPQIHNFELKELQNAMQSLIDCREQQIIDLQNKISEMESQKCEADELRQLIQRLTAKIQKMKLDDSLKLKAKRKKRNLMLHQKNKHVI